MILPLFCLLASLAGSFAVEVAPRTWTYYVEMRDGVKLHTRMLGDIVYIICMFRFVIESV
jgi:hypothetical protein